VHGKPSRANGVDADLESTLVRFPRDSGAHDRRKAKERRRDEDRQNADPGPPARTSRNSHAVGSLTRGARKPNLIPGEQFAKKEGQDANVLAFNE
jgi:hypothetical protein